MEKIFVTVGGLMDAKYDLINEKQYQTIGIINLEKIKNWNEIKKSSRWVNVNFQAQGDNTPLSPEQFLKNSPGTA